MPDDNQVAEHYSRKGLLDAIRAGLGELGKSPDTITVEDLEPVEEFHIGGRTATERFLNALAVGPDDRVLDAGCGLGGSSRFAAHHYGCRPSGIDLTPAFVEAGREINRWVDLEERVSLHQGSVTDMPFDDDSFDKAFVLHVGMNVGDKAALARELYRVLVDGGRAGIYDVMRTGPGEIEFPVPWASEPSASALADADAYRRALEKAGFVVESTTDRREFALEFFARLKEKLGAAGRPPPLGPHLIMGETTPGKIDNMVRAISRGTISPVEMLARKAH